MRTRQVARRVLPGTQEDMHQILAGHLRQVRDDVQRDVQRFVRALRTRIQAPHESDPGGDRSARSDSARARHQRTFELVPRDVRDLQGSASEGDGHEVCFTLPTGSYFTTVPASDFSGQPTEPDEVHEGPPGWPPIRFAFTRPSLGRIEIAAAISQDLPGQASTAGFRYTFASGSLAIGCPVFPAKSMALRVSVSPRVSALLACGGGLAGYEASLKLAVTSLIQGDSKSSVLPIAAKLAVVGGPLPVLEQFYNRVLSLSTELQVSAPDFVLVSLTLTSTVMSGDSGSGYALSDIEGLSSPPGRSSYFPVGGLQLSSVHLHDARSRLFCAPMLSP